MASNSIARFEILLEPHQEIRGSEDFIDEKVK
jgi:hypothetical protein